MPTYPVVCADRDTAQEYTVQITAESPQAALLKAAKAGHITSRIDTGSPQAPPVAEHHPTETDELLRMLIAEVRASRAEQATAAGHLAWISDFARHNRPLTRKVASGVILAMIVWSIFAAATGWVVVQVAAEAARQASESTFRHAP